MGQDKGIYKRVDFERVELSRNWEIEREWNIGEVMGLYRVIYEVTKKKSFNQLRVEQELLSAASPAGKYIYGY